MSISSPAQTADSQKRDSEKATPAPTDQAAPANGQVIGASDKSQEKNGEPVIAPYPISSPALGTGLQWVVGYVFRLNKEDKVTPPSFFGTVGMYTGNGSWGALIGGSFHLDGDKYRVIAAIADGNVNFDFYGIGKLAGDRGLFLPINVNGKGIGGQALVRVAKDLYIGPRLQLRQLNAGIDFSALKPRGLPDSIDKQPADIVAAVDNLLSTKTVAIGPHLQRDTCNDQFYPTQGTVLNAGGDFFLKALGSKFDYQIYQVRFEGYRSLSERQVLAFGSLGCAAAGDRVPFYDLCLYGARNYVRGYSAGRFQDRRMWATQLEYRLRLPKLLGVGFTERFGVVGFGGVGWVGKQLSDMAFDDLLPGGGAGLRFKLTRKYPINFRLDYGIGRVGHTVSMGVGEAF
jgi:Omp85 superfamily domain